MEWLTSAGNSILKLLREGPAGGFVLGFLLFLWQMRKTDKSQAKHEAEMLAHRQTAMQVVVIADTYAKMIAAVNEKKALRELRLAKKEEARTITRGKAGQGEDGSGGPNGEGSGTAGG